MQNRSERAWHQLPAAGFSSEEQAFYAALLAAGLIKEVKRRAPVGLPDFRPVPVRGAPVSETIIAGRR